MSIASQNDLAQQLFQLLVAGEEHACKQLIFDAYKFGRTQVQAVCAALASAFHKIGDAWECSKIDTYTEHVASQIGHRVLLDLRSRLPKSSPSGPKAIGCTAEKDPYSLPTMMVELVLRELGWEASSLGTNLPLELLEPALDNMQPELCWVSVSYVASMPRLKQQLSHLGRIADMKGIQVICGGQAIDEYMIREVPHLTYLPDLALLHQL